MFERVWLEQSGVEMHGDKGEEDQDNMYEKELDEEEEDDDQNKNEKVVKNDKYQDEDLRNCEGDSDREYKVQGVQSILYESCEEVYLMCNKKN